MAPSRAPAGVAATTRPSPPPGRAGMTRMCGVGDTSAAPWASPSGWEKGWDRTPWDRAGGVVTRAGKPRGKWEDVARGVTSAPLRVTAIGGRRCSPVLAMETERDEAAPPSSDGGASSSLGYDPGKGRELSKVAGGSVFFLVAIYGFSRIFSRRADYFSKVKIAARNEDEVLRKSTQRLTEAQEDAIMAGKRPSDVFKNASVVGFVSVLLYIASDRLNAYLTGLQLPDQYTVRQVFLLTRTVVVGLSYLGCFIYGANALGLTLLAIDMWRNPSKHAGAGGAAAGRDNASDNGDGNGDERS